VDSSGRVSVPVADDAARVLGGWAVLACTDYISSLLLVVVRIKVKDIILAIYPTDIGIELRCGKELTVAAYRPAEYVKDLG
jgi:hypothetical protein